MLQTFPSTLVGVRLATLLVCCSNITSPHVTSPQLRQPKSDNCSPKEDLESPSDHADPSMNVLHITETKLHICGLSYSEGLYLSTRS